VVTGESALPTVVGRATGQVTEVAADVGRARTAAAPIPAVAPIVPTQTPVDEPSPQTSVPGMSSDDLVPARRSLAPLVIIALLLLGGGIATYIIFHVNRTAPAPRDARIPDAALAIDAARPDAPPPVDAAPPIDAAVPIDAPHHVVVHHIDAATAIDAPKPPPPPTGSGIVTIKYKGDKYALISIDGGPSVAGPLNKQKLAAGPHTIRWYEATGQLRDTQTITVHDGDKLTVIEH
jgi:hypothetical protein